MLGTVRYRTACLDIIRMLKEYEGVFDTLVPLSKLRAPSDPMDESKNIVLVESGSFAPVHLNHINNLNVASQYLTQKGYQVLGGFICPTSDKVLKSKFKGDLPVSLYHRSKMLELAIQDTPWTLDLSLKLSYHILDHIQDVILRNLKWKVTALYVCGADVIELVTKRVPPPYPLLVVRRNTADTTLVDSSKENERITFVDNGGELTMSSSTVRELLLKGDQLELSKMLNSKVLDYLLKQNIVQYF